MPTVEVNVYYLEMFVDPARIVPPPKEGLSVVQLKRPHVGYYRFLYDSVGREYYWHSRGQVSDFDLAEILWDEKDEVYVLYDNGAPAGFAELYRHRPNDIELVQFGLLPEFIGQGLGKYFLNWIIDKAWSYQPERFWLHTCTLDHPAALPNYQQAGFVLYRVETKEREL